MTLISREELADLVDEKRAAEYLRLSVRTLQAARQDPLLAAACVLPTFEKQGRRIVYRRSELVACLEQRLEQPRLRRKFERTAEEAAA